MTDLEGRSSRHHPVITVTTVTVESIESVRLDNDNLLQLRADYASMNGDDEHARSLTGAPHQFGVDCDHRVRRVYWIAFLFSLVQGSVGYEILSSSSTPTDYEVVLRH
eukprot:GHVH01012106.1.p1 GENE.GHVH01012106.1~~GHVH01012106.1.p1  ORF type:complete len:108 (+),score=11.78 GHVH01012106.1:184-507(+)